ncbi:MAG: trigger factor [Gammaproteobacteria bacterium]|nr:trigger factor [Gammaproteobacteria bacterium]
MQVTVEANSKLERTVTVAVPEDKIASEVENRLRNLSRTSRIQGFRPGKAPYKLIQQRFGQQIRQEVVGMVLQSSLSEAITRESLRPAGSPEIGKFDAEQGKGLSYTAKFEVLPEIQLKPVEELKIERTVCDITDKDIDKMIDILRNQHFEFQD